MTADVLTVVDHDLYQSIDVQRFPEGSNGSKIPGCKTLLGAHHNNGNCCQLLDLSKRCTQLPAVHDWHIQIENDETGPR